MTAIPLVARAAQEPLKPKDWQDFQRRCVVLFRCELADPHALDYGRNGQNQHGIDILGRRNGDAGHKVGVQCRRVEEPLDYKHISKASRAAVKHFAGLREVVFATTAPDDTHAADAAEKVESELAVEGFAVRIVVYGWGQLQGVIARHPEAYAAFNPHATASLAPVQPQELALHQGHDFQAALQGMVALIPHVPGVRQYLSSLLAASSADPGPTDDTAEDPALHGRIDMLRDMLREDQPLLAEKGLLKLLEGSGLDGKPWARFRILSNLGSIALHLGREAEAIGRYEAAYQLRPSHPSAKANLSLVRTLQRRFEEAMSLAREALAGTPRAEPAVGYLLQAAARSSWEGDPEMLVPADLMDSTHADLGLVEFYRLRDLPGWQARATEAARRHPEQWEFKHIAALAVLSLAIEAGTTVAGGKGPVTADELAQAADDLKAAAERKLDQGFADEHDRLAFLNNACMLLRICGRYGEAEALLRRAGALAREDALLARQMAMALAALDRLGEAIAWLKDSDDPENLLFRSELLSADDPEGALEQASAVSPAGLSPHLATLRWCVIGELAIKAGCPDRLRSSVAGLRALEPGGSLLAEELDLRGKRLEGLGEEEFREGMAKLARGVDANIPLSTRLSLAIELKEAGLPDEGSMLLDGWVDLNRVTPTAFLYLRLLAQARRDGALQTALAGASQALREHPETLWLVAAHAWNTGDLARAHEAAAAFLAQQPDNAQARLFMIDILRRQDRPADVRAELEQPLEALAGLRPEALFSIASLLQQFGFAERAGALAYRLFIENREEPRAWTALMGAVLDLGRPAAERDGLWQADAVEADTAVDVAFDDGRKRFFVVEADQGLRRVDPDALEPDHPTVRVLMGKSKGHRFTDEAGREGTIADIRHKFVARLHWVMQHYEERFPDQQGFRSIQVDVSEPGGLDGIIAVAKERHDWVRREEEQYLAQPWPLAYLALRLGIDSIEVAVGLAGQGIPLKVAMGGVAEMQSAVAAVQANGRKGCVLDLLSYWTAWRLGVLDALVAECGPVHVGQRVLDRLRHRRERIAPSTQDGAKSASYDDGKLAIQETPAEAAREAYDDLGRAIAWLEANAAIRPVVAGDGVPDALRKHLRLGRSDIFDALIIAMETGLLLVVDDMPIRAMGMMLGFDRSCWTQVALGTARDTGSLPAETYVRCMAHLIGAGHDYIGVSGDDLFAAAGLDAAEGPAPGRVFRALTNVIGGRKAEPVSHVRVVLEFLQKAWSDPSSRPHREATTSLLVRQLLRERHADYPILLRALMYSARRAPDLLKFLRQWAKGHFIPDEVLYGEEAPKGPPSSPPSPRLRARNPSPAAPGTSSRLSRAGRR